MQVNSFRFWWLGVDRVVNLNSPRRHQSSCIIERGRQFPACWRAPNASIQHCEPDQLFASASRSVRTPRTLLHRAGPDGEQPIKTNFCGSLSPSAIQRLFRSTLSWGKMVRAMFSVHLDHHFASTTQFPGATGPHGVDGVVLLIDEFSCATLVLRKRFANQYRHDVTGFGPSPCLRGDHVVPVDSIQGNSVFMGSPPGAGWARMPASTKASSASDISP